MQNRILKEKYRDKQKVGMVSKIINPSLAQKATGELYFVETEGLKTENDIFEPEQEIIRIIKLELRVDKVNNKLDKHRGELVVIDQYGKEWFINGDFSKKV